MPAVNLPVSDEQIIAGLMRRVRRLETATSSPGGAPVVYTYTKTGAINVTTTGAIRLYNDTGADRTIIAVRLSLGVAPSTTSVIVDVNLGGTTIYTTTGNRPTLTTSSVTVAAALPDVTVWTAGDYLTVDVDQADVAASDMTLQVTVS